MFDVNVSILLKANRDKNSLSTEFSCGHKLKNSTVERSSYLVLVVERVWTIVHIRLDEGMAH